MMNYIDLSSLREKEKTQCKAVISRNPHFYKGPIAVTIVLGHELADQLEKEK